MVLITIVWITTVWITMVILMKTMMIILQLPWGWHHAKRRKNQGESQTGEESFQADKLLDLLLPNWEKRRIPSTLGKKIGLIWNPGDRADLQWDPASTKPQCPPGSRLINSILTMSIIITFSSWRSITNDTIWHDDQSARTDNLRSTARMAKWATQRKSGLDISSPPASLLSSRFSLSTLKFSFKFWPIRIQHFEIGQNDWSMLYRDRIGQFQNFIFSRFPSVFFYVDTEIQITNQLKVGRPT